MKKILILSACAALMTACDKQPKNWMCTCEYKQFGGSTGTKSKTIEDKTSSEASEECTAYGKYLSGGNGTYNCKTQLQ